jgi:hypothetical protein
MLVARYNVEDGYALAELVMRYPQARIYDLPSGITYDPALQRSTVGTSRWPTCPTCWPPTR